MSVLIKVMSGVEEVKSALVFWGSPSGFFFAGAQPKSSSGKNGISESEFCCGSSLRIDVERRNLPS